MADSVEVKKTMSDEEASQIREQNENIRAKREAEADLIATKFAKFKRDFIGAPILSAMNMMEAGKDGFKPCQINYRKDEIFWVFGDKGKVTVTFQVNFDNSTDRQLATIFLREMADSGRQVMNAQGVTYHDKE